MKLRHPESNRTIETRPEYAEMYRSQGWAESKSTNKSTSDKSDDK